MPYTELKEAAQQALEALERGDILCEVTAASILRAALAEPCDMGAMCLNCQPRGPHGECPDAPHLKAEPQDPVAWISRGGIRGLQETGRTEVFAEKDYECLGTAPLYAAPQPRKRLTDEEIFECDPLASKHMFDQQRIDFARAIEDAIWSKT